MKCFVIALAAIAAALAAYWPALGGEVIWDDRFLVGENPFFRTPGLAVQSFGHPLYPFNAAAYYRPLQNVSYAFDYIVTGGSHWGYHVTNILLHAFAAVLLWALLRRLVVHFAPALSTRAAEFIAAAAALCWLLHPIHHAAVGYVSGRADSIAAICALGAWLLFEKSCTATGRAQTFSAAGAAALALAAPFAKEIALVWFALFAVRLFADSNTRRHWKVAMCALVIIVSAYACLRAAALDVVVGSAVEPRSWGERFTLFLQAIGDYARVMFWPFGLHMERRLTPWSPPAPPEFLHPLTAVGIAVLVAFAWLALRPGDCRALRRFGIAWFFIGIASVSNLVPLNAEVAEHWIYMASAGALLIIASLVPRAGSRGAYAATALVCLGLGVRTFDQSKLWISEEQFFRRTIAEGGDSDRICSNLASLLARRGDLAGAELELRRGMARFPATGMLRVNLAENLRRQKRLAEAAEILDATPSVPQAPWSIAVERAMNHLAKSEAEPALRVLTDEDWRWPGRWDITQVRAVILERTGRVKDAIVLLQDYVTARPWHAAAVSELARTLASAGLRDEAVKSYLDASDLDPRNYRPWSAIADIRAAQGRIPDASDAQKEAVDRAPGNSAEKQKLDRLLEMPRSPAPQ